MNNKRRTKYDKLVAVNEKLAANFSRIDHPNTQQLAKLLSRAGPGLWEEAKKEEPSVTRSQIAAGLEQGLRDLSLIVTAQAPEIKSAVISAFRDAVQAEYPDFLEKDKLRLAKVVGRGHIRTENEWYLLQHRLDEIEGDPQHEKEVARLWELVDNYSG